MTAVTSDPPVRTLRDEVPPALDVRVVRGVPSTLSLSEWRQFAARLAVCSLGADPRWLTTLAAGLGHVPLCLEARRGDELRGLLPLALVRGLFGRFLVGLPFVSTAGILTDDAGVARPLVERAVALADELRVNHLELRLPAALDHAALGQPQGHKVLMRRPLPATAEVLWKDLDSKVRNQVRKGEKQSFAVQWGQAELLEPFYQVFSRNMRDLGTPVYGRRFFRSLLAHFAGDAEFCVLRLAGRPVAAALLMHVGGVSKVPCASTLREANASNANMFLYWQLLQRAIARGSTLFDFGRSTTGSGTERFKAQWDAEPTPAIWQRYSRGRRPSDLRKESPLFAALTKVWQRLPVPIAQFIGPAIVRGIP